MGRQFVPAKHRIPFNLASRHGRESRYLEEAFDEWHTAADGSFTRRCETLLREMVGSRGVLLTTSCTHAHEMCALQLDLELVQEPQLRLLRIPTPNRLPYTDCDPSHAIVIDCQCLTLPWALWALWACNTKAIWLKCQMQLEPQLHVSEVRERSAHNYVTNYT